MSIEYVVAALIGWVLADTMAICFLLFALHELRAELRRPVTVEVFTGAVP